MKFQIVWLTGFLFCHTCTCLLFAENEPHKTGRYTISFNERSPLSSFTEMKKRNATDINQPGDKLALKDDYKIDALTYEVVVPNDYDRSSPMGLMVWISSGSGGGPPGQLLAPLAKHGFIFIGANDSGNSAPLFRRLGAAIDAAINMQKLYNIDKNRIYISGHSGGGRCASYSAVIFPDVYTGGAFYVIGCNFWDSIRIPGGSGSYSGFWPNQKKKLIKQAKDHHFVFLTGSGDFNRPGTLGAYEAYKKQGFNHCKYLEVPGMGHATPPSEYFDKGLLFLNSSLLEEGKKKLSQGLLQMKMKKYPEAVKLLQEAKWNHMKEAQQHLDTIKAGADAQTEKGMKYLEQQNTSGARLLFQKIIRTYGEDMAGTAKEELDKIENDPVFINHRKAAERYVRIRKSYKARGKTKTAASLNKLIADYPDTPAAEKAKAALAKMGMS